MKLGSCMGFTPSGSARQPARAGGLLVESHTYCRLMIPVQVAASRLHPRGEIDVGLPNPTYWEVQSNRVVAVTYGAAQGFGAHTRGMSTMIGLKQWRSVCPRIESLEADHTKMLGICRATEITDTNNNIQHSKTKILPPPLMQCTFKQPKLQ